jgi:hypothetical protein
VTGKGKKAKQQEAAATEFGEKLKNASYDDVKPIVKYAKEGKIDRVVSILKDDYALDISKDSEFFAPLLAVLAEWPDPNRKNRSGFSRADKAFREAEHRG